MERLPTEITENGIHYTLHGDYYFPDITIPESDSKAIEKWGRMHREYLKAHRPGLYSQLILSGKLYQYLTDLNEQAQACLETIIRQMQHSEGVDEKMKAMDQMLWVGRMNNIRQRAEEIVIKEMVLA